MRVDLLGTPRRRRVLFSLLYLSEGAPVGYLWWAIPAKLRAAGVPVEEVAALGALLTVPWSLKFLWAPLVDVLRSQRFGLRPWIVGSQLAMGLALLPALGLDWVSELHALTACLLVHAICAATQDVAIDALAVKRVPERERGGATAWMQAGMLGGRAVFGGVALAAENWIGAAGVLWLLIATIWVTSGLALLARDRGGGGHAGSQTFHVFARRLARVLSRRATWLGLGFASLAGAGMEATGALAGPLLIDRGLSKEEVGSFFALPAVLCMAAGLALGGRLADRARRVVAAGGGVLAMALWIGLVAAAAGGALSGRAPLLVLLGGAYVGFGVVTAALYALMMDLTDPALGGTQFSAYMGAVNLCYVWSAWTGGQIAGHAGYPLALATLAGASLLALGLLPVIERELSGRRGDSVAAVGAPGARRERDPRP